MRATKTVRQAERSMGKKYCDFRLQVVCELESAVLYREVGTRTALVQFVQTTEIIQ